MSELEQRTTVIEHEEELYEKQLPSHIDFNSFANALKDPSFRREVLLLLPKHILEALEKERRRVYCEKYRVQQNKGNMYGNLSRIWVPEQVIEYFTTFKQCPLCGNREQARLLLLKQFFYGLRVGEVNTTVLLEGMLLVRIDTEK